MKNSELGELGKKIQFFEDMGFVHNGTGGIWHVGYNFVKISFGEENTELLPVEVHYDYQKTLKYGLIINGGLKGLTDYLTKGKLDILWVSNYKIDKIRELLGK